MCLIICAFAAFLSYVLNRCKVSFLVIMYASAAIMWLVDCTFAMFSGDDFFDISLADTYLGVIIVVSGVVFDSLLRFAKKAVYFRFSN